VKTGVSSKTFLLSRTLILQVGRKSKSYGECNSSKIQEKENKAITIDINLYKLPYSWVLYN